MKNNKIEDLNTSIDTVYDIIYKDLSLENNELSQALIELYKNAIRTDISKIQIGDYYIDMDPNNINICYDSTDTYIEINKIDQVIETHRPLEVKYYCITDEIKDTYPLNTPCIKVSGEAISMDGIKTDHRFIEILNPRFEMRIKHYVTDEVIQDTITRGYTIKEVDASSEVINPMIYFNNNQKLVPVKLNYFEKRFNRIEDNGNIQTYKKYFPRTANKIKIIKEMLNTLIELYNSFNI